MLASFPVKSAESTAFRKSRVAHYFRQKLQQYNDGEEPCLFLPSLLDMARTLDCSTLDIQSSLNGLRRQGYDYFYLHPHAPVTFWSPSKMQLTPSM